MNQFFHEPVERVFKAVESTPLGLSGDEVAKRLLAHGPNTLPEPKHLSWFIRILKKCTDVLVLILFAAAAISFVIGDVVDAVVIFCIAIFNILISLIQEAKAEHALEALRKRVVATAKVIRNGAVAAIPSEGLVVGDVIVLEAGDHVPADARLLESVRFEVQEGALTGESNPVKKHAEATLSSDTPLGDRTTMVFKGTVAVFGRGKAVVVATGAQTEIGRISTLLSHPVIRQTAFQKELGRLGLKLTIFACVSAGIIFAVMVVLRTLSLEEAFFTAVSLAVAVVPEGMPAVVTTVLAISVTRMAKQKATVRSLPAVEALGSVTAILTDKTGTLTQNRMTVTDMITHDERELFTVAILSSDATKGDNGVYVGDPTEVCLLEAAEKKGFDISLIRSTYERVYEIPFSSETKRMVVVVKTPEQQYVAMAKGATEVICATAKCDSTPFEETNRLANEGTRMLAFSSKVLGSSSFDLGSVTEDMVTDGHEYKGLIGMRDPLRPEVKEAVHRAEQAGITTMMITGDHRLIATHIAKELGIVVHETEVVEGKDIAGMSDEELTRTLETVRVFARVSPEDKLRIVKTAQTMGHVVAVTGDGVNDAPAIKAADIGIAMGKNGTDVAREVADIVLEDDNYATIVASVRQGRAIMHNFGKFLRYQISCNLSGVLFVLVAVLLGWPAPLLPVHILLLNLGSETAPSIALGLEPPEGHLMNMKPKSKQRPIISRRRWGNTLFEAGLLTITVVTAYGLALGVRPEAAQTVAFVTAFLSRLWHAYNCRSDRHSLFSSQLGKNKSLSLTIFGTLAVFLLLFFVPMFRTYIHVVPLTFDLLTIIIPLSFLPLVGVELRKYFLPPETE
jgi:Ca2+-transporting ATPase